MMESFAKIFAESCGQFFANPSILDVCGGSSYASDTEHKSPSFLEKHIKMFQEHFSYKT